jgi:shikimate dehydrogenase
MTLLLDGATRLHFIVGDPIAQVKSPGGVTQMLQDAGHNALVAPAHVAPADLAAFVRGAGLIRNVDGIIVTVPHKIAMTALCATLSDRAAFLGAVNTLRRNADGTWHGDMFDGLGYVAALEDKGVSLAGRSVLLAGAGGAGSAIAHALVEAGVARLAIHEQDHTRRDALIGRLAQLGKAQIQAGSPDPTGFDIAINATPTGMKASDPIPFDTASLTASHIVGDVITQPIVTPLIEAARARGCVTVIGTDMFAKVRDLMVAYLLANPSG